jgi:hypothetical protein
MMRKHVAVIAFTFMLVGLMIFSVDVQSPSQTQTDAAIRESPVIVGQIADGPVPQEPLQLNVIRNPNFEDWDSSINAPTSWHAQASGYQYSNAQYTDIVANGTYSGFVEGMGGPVSTANAYLYIQPSAPITDALLEPGISLSFSWSTLSIPDLQTGSEVYVYIIIGNTAGSNYYLYYYLCSAQVSHTNTTDRARINVNDTIDQWNSFDRNITEDFIDSFVSTPPVSTQYISSIWFYTSSPSGATGKAQAVFDDVVLYNSTYTGFLANGDFESGLGIPWHSYTSSVGYVDYSSESVLGSHSVNVTVPNVVGGSGFANCFKTFGSTDSYFAAYLGMNTIEVDWKYHDSIGAGISQYAYLAVSFSNGSFYQIYLYFGTGNNAVLGSNSTAYFYVKMPGFGVRDSWQHSVFDLYDIASAVGIYNASITNIALYAYEAVPGATVELLVDSFKMLTYPASDPTFEYDNLPSTSEPFLGWTRYIDVLGAVTKSPDAHSGATACNLTMAGVQDGIFRQGLYVELDNKLKTDYWWKLNYLDGAALTATYIQLQFYNTTDYKQIRYVIGRSASFNILNSSTTNYFFVDGFNQTGVWTNLARNLTADFENSFGISSQGWVLSGILLYAYAQPGFKVSCLFDDIQFADAEPPIISSVVQSGFPVYYNATTISVTAADARPGVSSVIVNYTTDGWSSWNTVSAVYSIGTYDANIPAQPYDTLVEYYVIAIDGSGLQAVDNNGGLFYSFIVGDDVAPTLTITNPVNNTNQEGLLTITAAAADAGAGVEYVTFNADGNGGIYDYSAPYQQNWNLDDEFLGLHFVIVTVRDNAGLEVTKTHYFTVVDTISPALNAPADVAYTVGETGNVIDWNPTDVRPNSYEVFVDGVSTYSGSWNSTSEHIVINVDGHPVGSYNYTCVAYDDAGNSAIDTVFVTVQAASATTTTTSTTGGEDLLTPLLIVASIGAVVILLVIFVAIPKMKHK